MKEDLYRFLAYVEYGLWQESPNYSSFINDRLLDDDFERGKFSVLKKMASSLQLGLLNYLPDDYDMLYTTVSNCDFPGNWDYHEFPRCKSFPEGFFYQHGNLKLLADFSISYYKPFYRKLNIGLDVICSDKPSEFYDFHYGIEYDRVKTLKSWKNGRLGNIYGNIKMSVSSERSIELRLAIMGILCLAYTDYLNLSTRKGYKYIVPTKGRLAIERNTDELIKCSDDPCVNLIGSCLERIRTLSNVTYIDQAMLKTEGDSPLEIVNKMAEKIMVHPSYKAFDDVAKDIRNVETLAVNVKGTYLRDMWKRSMKMKVRSKDEVISSLKSLFDDIKNPFLADIATKMVRANKEDESYPFPRIRGNLFGYPHPFI